MSAGNRELNQRILALAICTEFSIYLCVQLLRVALPLFFLEVLKSKTLIGILGLISGISETLTSLISPLIVSRIGSINSIIIAFITSSTAFLLLTLTNSIPIIFALGVIRRMSIAIRHIAYRVAIKVITSEPMKLYAYGKYGEIIAGVVGPLIAYTIIEDTGIRSVLILVAIIQSTAAFLWFLYERLSTIKESKNMRKTDKKKFTYWSPLNPPLVYILIIDVMIALQNALVFTYMIMYAYEYKTLLSGILGLVLLNVVKALTVSMVARIKSGNMMPQYLAMMLALLVIRYLALLKLNVLGIVLFYAITGFCYAGIDILVYGIISSIEQQRFTEVLSFFRFMYLTSTLIGNLLWGILLDLIGYVNTFMIAMILTLCTIPLSIITKINQK